MKTTNLLEEKPEVPALPTIQAIAPLGEPVNVPVYQKEQAEIDETVSSIMPHISQYEPLPEDIQKKVAGIVAKADSDREVVRLVDEAFPPYTENGVTHYSKIADVAVKVFKHCKTLD